MPYDIIFTKSDSYTIDEQVENFTIEFSIQYRDFIVSLIYLLSERVDMSFAVHKLSKFSSNPGKVHFEVLLHLLGYIRDNNTLGLNYYADIKDAPLSGLLRKANIKTENQFIYFSYYSWKDCPNTGRSTGAYIILYQGSTIDHGTKFPGPVDQ